MGKLIVIMIDGVSADYFLKHKKRLPSLANLANKGLVINRLSSVTPATSLPGRTTMMTGTSCDMHGVWGNTIWDGERFRYATPDDVKGLTLTKQAVDAGLDVAVVGYGMLPPEDAHVFHHAWWVGEMVQRARDDAPIPAAEGWLRTSRHKDATGRLSALVEQGYPEGIPDAYSASENPPLNYFAAELSGDAVMMQWTTGLACSEQAPDLIVTEILTPDSVQHVAGYESDVGHWSIHYADALVGQLVRQLESEGVTDYNFAIMSDHGHSVVHTALNPMKIIPEATYACECAWLYVHYSSEAELADVASKLAVYDIEPYNNEQVVPEFKNSVATFIAPEGMAFENSEDTEVKAAPKYTSSHGFRPGTLGDDRFCVFSGPDFSPQVIEQADALQITPTLAKILGLDTSLYPAQAIK